MENNGPTQNESYNHLLRKWAASGHPSEPRCEECDCDMTDHDVIEGYRGWYCTEECCDNANDGNVDDSQDNEPEYTDDLVDFEGDAHQMYDDQFDE
jgi:hypothetical protein